MLKIVEVGSQQRLEALRAAEDTRHDYLYICHYNDSIKLSNNGALHNFTKLQVCATQEAYDAIATKDDVLYIVQRGPSDYALYFGSALIKTGAGGDAPSIGDNGNWFIGTVDTGVKAQGEDGITPHIGDNYHWFVGDVDTGVRAKGIDGQSDTVIKVATLAAANWDADTLTQTIAVEGVLADELKQVITVDTTVEHAAAYDTAGVRCVSHADGSLTFATDTLPENDITVYIVLEGVEGVDVDTEDSEIIYSIDETVVGRWIDGRPLYQKTIVGITTPSKVSGEKLTPLDIEDLDVCWVYDYFLYQASTNSYMSVNYANYVAVSIEDKQLRLYVLNATLASMPTCVTIRYTKNTDIATIEIPGAAALQS